MSEGTTLQRVVLNVCGLCLGGAGGECHVPGCAFWMDDAPRSAIRRVLAANASQDRWTRAAVGDDVYAELTDTIDPGDEQ